LTAPRRRVDAALTALVRTLEVVVSALPPAIGRAALRMLGGTVATLSWPFGELRRRSRGHNLRPWAWGSALGDNLAALLGVPVPLDVQGWPDQLEGTGTVVLAAHLGRWEAGAAELARRGVRPLVIVAPWPRLPSAESLVARLRGDRGVRTRARSSAALRDATRHLRDGGWVIVLVDSASPARPGRRAVAFGDVPIAAPDGLVSWAARQGAALVVAEAEDRAFRLRALRPPASPRRLPAAKARSAADEVVHDLRSVVLRRPEAWAWVRPLAVIALLLSAGCGAAEPLPPLPLDPELWRADIEGFAWEGELGEEQGAARLTARSARVRLIGAGLVGTFDGLEIVLEDAGGDRGTIRAESAIGALPEGPMTLRRVRWDVDGLSGELERLLWTEQGRWSCGGCSLEDGAARLGAPGR